MIMGTCIAHPSTLSVLKALLTRSLREPGGPCTKSMEVSESHMERVNNCPGTVINENNIVHTLHNYE